MQQLPIDRPTCPAFLAYTVFIRIVAAASINFSLARVRLLIKGGSYSRVTFINFGVIPPDTVHKNDDMKTGL